MNIIDSGKNSIVSRNFAESASLNCFLKATRFNCIPVAGCSLVTKETIPVAGCSLVTKETIPIAGCSLVTQETNPVAGCLLVTKETIPVAGCLLVTKGIIEKLKPVNLTPPDRVRDASQNAIELISKTRLPIRMIGNKGESIKAEVDFYVSNSEDTNCVLLGRNFMKVFGTTELNFESKRIRLGHIWCNGL